MSHYLVVLSMPLDFGLIYVQPNWRLCGGANDPEGPLGAIPVPDNYVIAIEGVPTVIKYHNVLV